mmetsp:Transcript_12556/g.18764  ORF Transcript_12556/g.18764 Transcript_12556/m.18764 type:complete len:89 (+) Transcript_12556:617-883(+)
MRSQIPDSTKSATIWTNRTYEIRQQVTFDKMIAKRDLGADGCITKLTNKCIRVGRDAFDILNIFNFRIISHTSTLFDNQSGQRPPSGH